MVHAYFYAIPSKMYPLEHILTHNPILTPGFYERMKCDSVMMRCVVGTGLFMQTIVNGVRCNDEILGFMANLYAVVNEQLQTTQANIRPALVECICSMAIGAVSREPFEKTCSSELMCQHRHTLANMITGEYTCRA